MIEFHGVLRARCPNGSVVESWLRDGESGVQSPEVAWLFGGEKEIGGRGDEISTRPPDGEAGETGESSYVEGSP